MNAPRPGGALALIHQQAQGIPCFSGICACRRCADSITSDTMYAVNGSPKECAFEAKEKSTNISPYPNEAIERLARAFYPAILACWNSVEGQRSLLRGRQNRLISPAKKNRKFPVGELPPFYSCLPIVCGFFQGASGSWVFVKQFSRNNTATACQDWLRVPG